MEKEKKKTTYNIHLGGMDKLLEVSEMFKNEGEELTDITVNDTKHKFESDKYIRRNEKTLYLFKHDLFSKGTEATTEHKAGNFSYSSRYELQTNYGADEFINWVLISQSKYIIEKEDTDDES